MNRCSRSDALRIGVLALTGLVLVGVLLSLRGSGDYAIGSLPGADNAGPPLKALASGRVAELPALQPVMGLVSLLWRAPFVALATDLDAGHQLIYTAGCAGCMLSAVALIAWLLRRAGTGAELLWVAVAAVVILAGPATVSALDLGHPEEVLTTVLAAGAVLAARANHRTRAAILLGLAVGSKQWAVLMSPAVVVALPGGRTRAALIAGAVAAAASLPLPLLDPAAFHRADATIGGRLHLVVPLSLWWPLALATHPSHDAARVLPFGLRRSDGALTMMTVCLGVIWALGRIGPPRGGHRATVVDPLALLALLGLLRCLTDPFDAGYYLVAMSVPLAVWEATSQRRLPIVSVLWCGVTVIFGTNPFFFSSIAPTSASLRAGCFLSSGLILAAYLTLKTFGVNRHPVRRALPQLSSRIDRQTLA